jgi:FAD/FMN-containing dehydrogenase
MSSTGHADLLRALRAELGEQAVREPHDGQPLTEHLQDWRGRYHGRALAVVSPADTAGVATAVRLCAAHGASLVPQGGNTSLVGGSVPDASGKQVVLSLRRLNRVLSVDENNLSMTAQAGCTLAEVQQAAALAGLLFPLSLASEGTCTLGGVLATNAGGTQVLRYGTARELCLGLEVVTAQGEVWSLLKGLRKDNTGYDLRHLLIGSEGTLGIITAASLRLYPAPKGCATALVPCANPAAAVALLRRARLALDAGLTACELMAPLPLSLVHTHLPDVVGALAGVRLPTAPSLQAQGEDSPWWLLLEAVSPLSDADAQERLASVLVEAGSATADSTDAGGRDGASPCLSQSLSQRAAMWRLREAIPMAEKIAGRMVKHDIGLPTSRIPDFIAQVDVVLRQRWPDSAVVCFGHLGDGNLHFNVQPPADCARGDAFEAFELAVNTLVFDTVQALGGTISAEHGIGELRKHELARRHPPAALAAMQAIKLALDPKGVLNPGRMLPAAREDAPSA